MPGLDGLALQQALTRRGSPRPIIFLTGKGDIPTSVRAMKAGAIDFLTKPVSDKDLLEAIARAEEQDEQIASSPRRAGAIQAKIATLTPREREVLTHVVAGRLNKQIAGDLGTVEKTIKVHRGRMMEKLGVRTVADLVRMAEKRASASPKVARAALWPNGQLDARSLSLSFARGSFLDRHRRRRPLRAEGLGAAAARARLPPQTFGSAREFLASLPKDCPNA